MIDYLFIFIGSVLGSVLLAANWSMRRKRRILNDRLTAAQLRRGAGHIYKIAGTANIYVMQNAISRLLLQETSRMLELAVTLEPHHLSTRAALRECNAMRAALDETKRDASLVMSVAAKYPDSEHLLLEAKMHLTEASRLLGGMEKRGLLSHRLHQSAMTALLDAQRSLELHLNLKQAIHSLKIEDSSVSDPENFQAHQQTNAVYA